ncbi:MAG: EAL domain-containing protein [Vicinamibacteria bacterium]|nr:EAL domain-containing protein [Vicinamibacteria bacterium]
MSATEADYYRLRTEWLRYKSHLVDSLTGLPTLPGVVDDVRRLLEGRGAVELLYIDLGRSGWHETKVGWGAYDRAVREFAAVVASLRAQGALAPDDLVCLQAARGDRFLFFLPADADAPGPASPLLARLRAVIDEPSARGRLGNVRLAAAVVALRHDPMARAERAISQAVADATAACFEERLGGEERRRAELQRLIDHREVRSVFHPILSLADGKLVGHEALTRPLGDVPFDSVEELFAFAESTDLLIDFERVCRDTAIRSVAGVAPRGLLFLNASAHAMEDPDWRSGKVAEALARSGLTPGEVVVEVTERVAILRHDAFQETLRSFKERGYRVAVDDMGAGYSSLQSLAAIEPDFLKFDVSLVRDIDKSSIKRSLLESLKGLADKIKARVIAEGIERVEERDTLVSLGIELGQGFLFHREDGL